MEAMLGKILPKSGKKMPSADALAADARRLVEEAAATRRPGETVEAMLARVAYMTGFSYSRIRTFWQRKPAAYRHGELDTLRHRILALQQRQQEGIDHVASLRRATALLASGGHRLAADGDLPAAADAEHGGDERGRSAAQMGDEKLTGWGFRLSSPDQQQKE